jgi:hypothetical protein
MTFIDQLKAIYGTLPRPHHVAVCKARFEEAKRGMPAPRTGTAREYLAQSDISGPSLDLQIYVDDTIPPNEIHLVSYERVNGERFVRVDKIVNLENPLLGIDPSRMAI